MKKYAFAVIAVILITGGTFFFFHATPSVCTPMRDPSGGLSPVCTLGTPSPYQRLLIMQHMYFYPHDMCATNVETGALDCKSFPTSGCDQSATTTDCSKLIEMANPMGSQNYLSPALSYTEVTSTSQSGKIDEHLSVDNTLVTVQFCDKVYKTRQIFIDGADVVRRIAELATTDAIPGAGDNDGNRPGKILCMTMPNPTNTQGILETSDVASFTGSDVGLPGTTYRISFVGGNAFVINPETAKIYRIGGYDGSLGDSIGALWKTFVSNELGISFSYPHNGDTGDWRIGNGTTGKAFQATISLPSGAVIYAYATTKDYSTEKDGFAVGTEGFIVRNDKYYAVVRGKAADTPFTPDEVWRLGGVSAVPVMFGKNYDLHADYPEAPAKAMINLPGPTFTGIGFVLFNTDGPHAATPEDLAIFKRVMTSISLIR